MNREFVSHDVAVAMKELGFIEPCLKWVIIKDKGDYQYTAYYDYPIDEDGGIDVPLYQQAFRWFIEECGMDYNIFQNTDDGFYYQISTDAISDDFDEYEQAQNACLQALIKMVKQHNNL